MNRAACDLHPEKCSPYSADTEKCTALPYDEEGCMKASGEEDCKKKEKCQWDKAGKTGASCFRKGCVGMNRAACDLHPEKCSPYSADTEKCTALPYDEEGCMKASGEEDCKK